MSWSLQVLVPENRLHSDLPPPNPTFLDAQKTGKSYNIADIRNDAEGVLMPPLLPPPESKDTLVQRADDTEEVIKNRLRICAFLCCCSKDGLGISVSHISLTLTRTLANINRRPRHRRPSDEVLRGQGRPPPL